MLLCLLWLLPLLLSVLSWFSLFLFISSLSSSLGVFFVSILTLCWRLILLISFSSVTSSPFSGSFIAIFSLGWIFCPFMIFLMLYILWFRSFPLFPSSICLCSSSTSSLYIVRISSGFFFPFGFLWFLLFHFTPNESSCMFVSIILSLLIRSFGSFSFLIALFISSAYSSATSG